MKNKKLFSIVFALILLLTVLSIFSITAFAEETQLSLSGVPNIEPGTQSVVTYLDISKYVSGGTAPYTYSIESLGPDYDAVDSSMCIDAETGLFMYSRNSKISRENKIKIEVTDAENHTVSTEITVGIITRPDDYQAYSLVVGGVRVTNVNKDNILGDSTVSFNPEINVLSLKKATINAGYTSYTEDGYRVSSAIYTEKDLEIQFTGKNDIGVSNASNATGNKGIYEPTLRSITADAGSRITFNSEFDGTINTKSGIHMDNGQIIMKGGKVYGALNDVNSNGIYYYGGLINVWSDFEETDVTCVTIDNTVDEKYYYVEASNSIDGSDPFSILPENTNGYHFDCIDDTDYNSHPYLQNLKVSWKTKVDGKLNIGFDVDKVDITQDKVDVSVDVCYSSYKDVLKNGENKYTISTNCYVVSDTVPYKKSSGKFVEGTKYCISDGTYENFIQTYVDDVVSYKYYFDSKDIEFYGKPYELQNTIFVAEPPAITEIKIFNRRITQSNSNDILGDGSISYIPESNTIEINKNIDIATMGIKSNLNFVYYISEDDKKLNIVINKGCSSITIGEAYVFLSNHVMEVKVKGELTLTCGNMLSPTGNISITGEDCLNFINTSEDNNILFAGTSATINAKKDIKIIGTCSLNTTIEETNISCGGNLIIDCTNKKPLFLTSIKISVGGKLNITKTGGYISTNPLTIEKSASVNINGIDSLILFTDTETNINSSGDITISNDDHFIGYLNTVKGKNVSIKVSCAGQVLASDGTKFECENLLIENYSTGIITYSNLKFINKYDNYVVYTKARGSDYTEVVSATDEGYTISKDLSMVGVKITAHNHSYKSEISVPATCTTDGKVNYNCVSCSDSYSKTIPATGHKSDNGTVTKKATCTAKGTKTYKCTVCGNVLKSETIKATGHKAVTLKAKTATTKASGLTEGSKCSVCGKILKAQTMTLAQATGLKASKQSTSSVVISWTKIAGAKYYKLEKYVSGKWTTITTTTSTSYTVSKLSAGTSYKFRVTAMNSTKKISGKASATLTATTLCKAPTIKLTSTKSKTATVKITKVTGAKSYAIYKSTDGKKWTKVTTTTKTSYTLTKLSAGKKIYVRVCAVNSAKQNSAYSKTASVTVKK